MEQTTVEAVKAVATPDNFDTAQKYINFVKDNLEPLAQQIGVSVEWLWKILVQQARVEAIIYLAVSLSISITAIIFIRMFFKNIKLARWGSYGERKIYKHNETGVEVEYSDLDWSKRTEYDIIHIADKANVESVFTVIGGTVGAVMMLVSIILASSSMQTIVTGLVNPEYRAIEKIVDFTVKKDK